MRGAPAPERRHWIWTGVLGLLFLGLGNGGVVWSELRVPSGLAALLVAMVPVWTVLVDWLRPRGVRPGLGVIVGLLIGFAGTALLVAPGEVAGRGGVDPVGAAVLMFSTLAWSIGSVASSRVPLPSSPLLATGMEMLGGGAFLLVAGIVAGEPARLDLGAITLRSGLALAYLIVFGSLVAFTAFVWLLRVTTPARVATYAYVNPIVAVILGWAVLGEPLSARTLVAAAVIVGAVVLITAARARRAPEVPRAGAPAPPPVVPPRRRASRVARA
jgi:drug/metabolite transporter (DMT)-like permease